MQTEAATLGNALPSNHLRTQQSVCRQRLSIGGEKEKQMTSKEYLPQTDHDNQDEDEGDDDQISQERMALLANQKSLKSTSSEDIPPKKSGSLLKRLLQFFFCFGGQHRVHAAPSSIYEPRTDTENISTATLKGSAFLYSSLLLTLLFGPQLGWEITQLNLTVFHNHEDCIRRPVEDGTCTIFPGHSNFEWVLAVVAWVIGAAVGSLFANVPAEKFGRRRVIFLNALFMFLGSACQTFAQRMSVFVLGRLLSGICSGSASTIASIYLGEISPEESRATFVVAFQVAGSVGLVSITSAHFAVTGSATSWRWIMMIPMCISMAELFCIPFFLVESPRWLIQKQRFADAKCAFDKLYRQGCFEELRASIQEDNAKSHAKISTESVPQDQSSRQMFTKRSRHPIQLFFQDSMSPRYRAQFLMSMLLCLARQLGGVSAVFYYSSSIFKKAGIPDARLGNLILASVNAITVAAVCSRMKHLPRRKALLFGISGMILASSCMTAALARKSVSAVFFTALYVISNCVSLGTLPFLVTAEILPKQLRGMGLSITSSANWLANLFIGMVFPTIARILGNFSFVPFTCLLFSFWLFVYLFLPETKDRSYDAIELEFSQRKKPFLFFRKGRQHVASVAAVSFDSLKLNQESKYDSMYQDSVRLRRASLEVKKYKSTHRPSVTSTISRMA